MTNRNIDIRLFADNYHAIKAHIPYWICETKKRLPTPYRKIVGRGNGRDYFHMEFRDEIIESELVHQALLLTRSFRCGGFMGYLHTYLVRKTVNALTAEIMRLNRELPLSFIIPKEYERTDEEYLDAHSQGYVDLATQGWRQGTRWNGCGKMHRLWKGG